MRPSCLRKRKKNLQARKTPRCKPQPLQPTARTLWQRSRRQLPNEKKPQSKPAQTATKPATPTVKEEQKAQPTISNGAYIFFDDDTQVPPSKSPAKKKTAYDASNKKKDTNKQEKDRTNKQDDDSQKTNDNKDPKDNTFDLEDEYYDLDGF